MADRAGRTDRLEGARIIELTSAQTHPLRAQVLRVGTPSSDLTWAGDEDDTTIHLGVVIGAATDPVAISTWLRTPSPDLAPDLADGTGAQLRGMATDPSAQGLGAGSLLLRAGIDRALHDGADHVWANARIAALDFYLGHGFAVTSEEFLSTDTALPHRRILRHLRPA